ncbi:MAG TPA: matrixin family metalloprotease [Blastocatellia bacterium]|nr:matrixin family metalloprotease [Blastocatellia bacterium]
MKRSCFTLLRIIAFLFLFYALTPNARATTVVMPSDTELIVNSRLILTGRVVSVTSTWDDQHSMVWTYVEVLVERTLKGELPDGTIVLKQMGGAVGESGVYVFGQSRFAPGERVLLYLNSAKDGSLHVAHIFAGKFSVVGDTRSGEFVVRRYDTDEVALLERSASGDVTDRAPFDDYVRQIRQILKRESSRVAEIDAARTDPMVVVPAEYARVQKHASGFTPEFVLFSGGVRWMEADSGQAINYYVNSSGAPVAGGGAAEITRAMSAWPNQSGANIHLQVAGQTGSCGIVADNVNTISFGDCANQLDPPIGCGGIVALTGISYIRDTKVIAGTTFNRLVDADTVFNKGIDCFLGNSSNLAEVACHELGHSIGLAHSTDPNAIMWATAHGRGRDAVLGSDDIAGALAIYPASSGGRPGPTPITPVGIATAGLSDGAVGQYYLATLTATGGVSPYRWSLVGGTMPAGLNFASNGTIDGFPTNAGSYSFAVQVYDSSNKTDAKLLSLTVRPSNVVNPPGVPRIASVKTKGDKKLWVSGQNISSNAYINLNGVLFQASSFEQDGAVGTLFVKRKLNLGPTGTNLIIIIDGGYQSAPFYF